MNSVMPRANGPNIVGCYMLRPFTHPVACCWELLNKVRNQSNFQLHANGRNNSQKCRELLRPFAHSFNSWKRKDFKPCFVIKCYYSLFSMGFRIIYKFILKFLLSKKYKYFVVLRTLVQTKDVSSKHHFSAPASRD